MSRVLVVALDPRLHQLDAADAAGQQQRNDQGVLNPGSPAAPACHLAENWTQRTHARHFGIEDAHLNGPFAPWGGRTPHQPRRPLQILGQPSDPSNHLVRSGDHDQIVLASLVVEVIERRLDIGDGVSRSPGGPHRPGELFCVDTA